MKYGIAVSKTPAGQEDQIGLWVREGYNNTISLYPK
jgi:hypothetical protein